MNFSFIEVPIYQGTSKRAKVLKIIAMLGILIILATSVTSVAYLTIGNGKEEKGKLKTAEVVCSEFFWRFQVVPKENPIWFHVRPEIN